MSFAQKIVKSVGTNASGAATAYSDSIDYGQIHAIFYDKVDYADGIDITIELENSGEILWQELNVNATKKVYPRHLVQDVAGADIAAEYGKFVAVRERVKITIAQGGDTKTGTFTIITN